MSYVSDLSQSVEYLSFRSNVPLRRIVVDSDINQGWRIYDCGPKKVRCPLICLPPVSGTADIFFKQALALSAKGVRVISAEAPVYEYTSNCPRVASLILCNTFSDTSVFNNHDSAALFWILPSLVLKKMVMGNFSTSKVDREMVEAIDFMVERLESLPQTELASRLTLNCLKGYVEAHKLSDIPITIIDVFDESALSNTVREEMYKCYPHAKLAHLKSGGNFPFLSRCGEVNLHLQIHLRQFDDTNWTAADRLLIKRN